MSQSKIIFILERDFKLKSCIQLLHAHIFKEEVSLKLAEDSYIDQF